MRNYDGFGQPLSRELYLEREHALNLLPFGAGGFRWALVDTESGGWTATCETYHRPCLFTAEQGGRAVVKDGTVAVVASVFTPVHLRGRGYAAEMIRQLKDRLETFDGVVCSTLYSDIGPTFYANLGWAKCPSKEAVIAISKPLDIEREISLEKGLPTVRGISNDELFQAYLPADVARLPADLLKEIEAKGGSGPLRTFAVTPIREAIEWLWERSHFYQRAIAPAGDQPRMTFTYAIGTPTDPSWSFFVLFPNFKEDKLVIQRIRIAAKSDAEAEQHALSLLLAVVREARLLGLGKVVAWDSAPCVDRAFESLRGVVGEVRIGERDPDDSLSSICWYGDGAETETVWIANEKYAWA